MTARYERFVERNMNVTIRTGNEFMTNCPFHGGHDSLQVNVQSGLWICFGCQEKGNVEKLIKKLGARFHDPGEDLVDIKAKLNELTEGKPSFEELPPLPEDMLKRYAFPTDYWEGRGFAQRTVNAFDLGYDPLNNIATIPIRNTRGQLIGFIKRDLEPDAVVRYRYPKGFKRSHNLFGSWLIEAAESRTCILTEGSLDTAKVWQAGLPSAAIYGSSLSMDQMRLLMRLGVTRIVLFFDNDKAGKKATQRAIGLVPKHGRDQEVLEYKPYLDARSHFLVSSVTYGSGPRDPGAMNTLQIRNAVASATDLL